MNIRKWFFLGIASFVTLVQAQEYPPLTSYEIQVLTACRLHEQVLYFFRVEKNFEGEIVPVLKVMYCIAQKRDIIIEITCRYQTKSCDRPVQTSETVRHFRDNLR